MDSGAEPLGRQRRARPVLRPGPLARPLGLVDRHPWWSAALLLLFAGSLVYTYAGTVARETFRQSWLPQSSVPLTLDGMAFMKVAYPDDYAGITWLNAHVRGTPVIAEAGNSYYNWRSRVAQFTGLPDVQGGIHEGEQRYGDELTRDVDVRALYTSPRPADAWSIIRRYGIRYIYVGFSERQCAPDQCYSKAGLDKFNRMVGHGLRVAFRHGRLTIYEVTRA
jgi:uncharacterized membrane protein